MRITPQLLLKNARETVERRVAQEPGLLAAYLCGSLLPGHDPVLGGAADIDLVFIYETTDRPREIVRLTNEVHLDIQHRSRAQYEPARDLREQAWLGHEATHAQVLYDNDHFFDFIQASARSLFDAPENAVKRATPFFERARATWFDFYTTPPASPFPPDIARSLSALDAVANGSASLPGPPLPVRRFLLDLPERLETLEQPDVALAIGGLLGVGEVNAAMLRDWLADWEAAFLAVEDDPRLHAQRMHYYRDAITALLDDDNLPAALWPLLRTWTDAVSGEQAAGEHVQAWQAAAAQLRLLGESDGQQAFALRINGLDALLDRAEEFLEGWRGGLG